MHLPRALVLSAAVPALLALPVVSRPERAPRPVPPVVREHRVAGIDAAAASGMPGFSPRLAGPVGGRPLALSRPTTGPRFAAIGVTWAAGPGEAEVAAAVRVRQAGRWTPWHVLQVDADHGPDAGTPDASRARDGSEPWFCGPADGYQVRLLHAGGRRPTDVRVALVDPGRSPADARLGATTTLGGSHATASAGRPAYVSRRQWGADERLRSGSPDYASTVKVGFVHHTDTSNSYSSSQAAAMVRSVYAFHTRSRGWSDIGYNFLVDRYGRLFEGRYGGVDRPVIGAHTGGFNSGTFGLALLGSFSNVAPPAAALTTLQRTFAWKLGLHYANPLGRTTLTSAGSSKYRSGTRVAFHNVSGHRDASLTACPGYQTYVRLPAIRDRIRGYMGASLYYPSITTARPLYLATPSVTVRATPARAQYWRVTVTDRRTGATLRRASGQSARPYVYTWNLRDPDGVPVPPGFYRVSLESWTSGNTARPYVVDVEVRSPLPSGVTVTDPDGVVRIVAGGRVLTPAPALAAALREADAAIPAYPSQLRGFPGPVAPAPDGALLRTPDGATWAVTGGHRRAVPGAVISALRLPAPKPVPPSAVAMLPQGPNLTDTSRHPDGQLVTDGTTTWRLESGVRRPFTSDTARLAWARGRATAPANAGDLALPIGPALPPPDGALLTTPDGAAGVVSAGAFRRFADMTVAEALGYAVLDAPLATADDLAALPAGEPITGEVHPDGALLVAGSAYWELRAGGRRAVDPALAALDARAAVAPLSGELDAQPDSPLPAPDGFAARGGDGRVRVVADGRLVTLTSSVARSLGYDAVTLPALEPEEFGVPTAGSVLPNPGRHPDGTLVTDGATTWLVSLGMRRPLGATLAPSWHGRPAVRATAGDLALPVGPPAPPDSGAWLVTEDGAHWLVEYGVRRSVPPAVATRLGLAEVAALPVDLAELLAATTEGPAVS